VQLESCHPDILVFAQVVVVAKMLLHEVVVHQIEAFVGGPSTSHVLKHHEHFVAGELLVSGYQLRKHVDAGDAVEQHALLDEGSAIV
jgi:hypothetical protein